jgi:hypothetical protein
VDLVLIIIGAIVALTGYVWLLIACFSESIGWGIGALFCGIVALVFGILNWADLKVPTILYISGGVLYAIGEAIK